MLFLKIFSLEARFVSGIRFFSFVHCASKSFSPCQFFEKLAFRLFCVRNHMSMRRSTLLRASPVVLPQSKTVETNLPYRSSTHCTVCIGTLLLCCSRRHKHLLSHIYSCMVCHKVDVNLPLLITSSSKNCLVPIYCVRPALHTTASMCICTVQPFMHNGRTIVKTIFF